MNYWLQALLWIVGMGAAGLAIRPLVNRANGGKR